MLEDSHVTDWVFHIPRILNNLDVSGWAWWLVYINARGQKYSELLELSEDPESPLEKCIATYSVDYGMSIKAGIVRFSLEAINTDTGGEILNEWHTQTYQAKVQDTLQGNQVEFAETESDIISALIVEIQNKVRQLVGGATPEPVSLIADMTDTKKVYLYVGEETGESTNYWYYYNGSAWVAGGLYASGITVDSVPTQGSNNAVRSGGVYSALEDKADKDSTPETVTPEETDADFYLSDENGNVILELAEGHIKTKNFDSSNIDPSPTESGNVDFKRSDSTADLVFTDNSGNVIAEFLDGHVKTANFDSADIADNLEVAERISGTDYAKTFTYDASTATTQTITADFKQGDIILCHLHNTADDVTDFLYARLATYGYIDTNGTQHALGTEYAYNFGRFVLPEDATGIYGTFPANLEASGTYSFQFLVYKLSDYARQPNIVTVGADGRRQYTSVRQAMDSFHDNNAYNRYEIWVYPGTYNIMDDFTDAEIRTEGFKGLFVKNGVKIKGIGHREQIILHGELGTEDYSVSIRNQISTLNMSGCCGLENLTVTNRYLRYAVHDDHGSGFYQEQTRIVENCKFMSTDASSGGIGQAAYGAGGHNNKKLIIRNCDLGDRLIIHNTQLMVVPMFALVENCTAQQVTLTDNNNTGFTAKTRVEFNNCNFDYVLHDRTSDGTEPTMILCGTGSNNIKLDCEANTLYNFGDCMTFPATISAGQAVKMSGIRTVEATTSKADMYGLSIGNDGSHTYVQRKGYIAAQVLGLTGLSVGDYITLNSSGICVAGGTVNDAVGVVECIAANTSTAFIKLLF